MMHSGLNSRAIWSASRLICCGVTMGGLYQAREHRAVTKEDLICITGSFYLVGEAKKVFAKMARQEAAEAAAAAGSA